MSANRLLGGIEAGGTKVLCAVADDDGTILTQTRIATTTPGKTLAAADAFFAEGAARHGALTVLGIGSFGPLSLDPDAPDYGSITSTPKPGWQGVDLLGHFRRTLAAPVALDTDVNCAAVAEYLFGSARGVETACYITVGTGIGVGVLIGGVPHGGANHPEAGHIPVPRAPGDTAFAGSCPYHGDCLEGLAAGPALAARWGAPADTLSPDHPAWAMEADYIATLCAVLGYVVRPDRIVLGGGIGEAHDMLARVRPALAARIAGYDRSLARLDLDRYLVAPSAGASAGLTGALALAYRTATGDWPRHWSAGR